MCKVVVFNFFQEKSEINMLTSSTMVLKLVCNSFHYGERVYFMGCGSLFVYGMLMVLRMGERKAAPDRVSKSLNLPHTWRMQVVNLWSIAFHFSEIIDYVMRNSLGIIQVALKPLREEGDGSLDDDTI